MTRRILDHFPDIDPAALNAFELAAIVYDEGASVDHLMGFLAREIRAGGRTIGGVLALPADDGEAPAEERLIDLASGEVRSLGPRSRHRTAADELIEAILLADMTRRVKGAIKAGADLAFIPRFGAREIAGAGFSDAFGTVAAFGVPILTAVERRNVDAWLRFTGGIGTLLACRLRVVRPWWQETDERRRRLLVRRSRERQASGGAQIIPLRPTFA